MFAAVAESQGLPALWQELALSPRDVRAGSVILHPAPTLGGVCSHTGDRGTRTLSFSQNTNESWPSLPCGSNGKKASVLALHPGGSGRGGPSTAGRRRAAASCSPGLCPRLSRQGLGEVTARCGGRPSHVPASHGLCCCDTPSQLSTGQASPCGLWMGR